MNEKGIRWFATESDTKAANAEVMIRELKRRLYRYMTHNSTDRYVDVLDRVAEAYNSRKHPKTGFAPNEVGVENSAVIFKKLYPSFLRRKMTSKPKFMVGDKVRIAMQYSKLRHGYLPSYSEEIFTVSRVLTERSPVRYKLKEENDELFGSWDESEMIKVIEN